MNQEDLFEAIGGVEDDLIIQSEERSTRRKVWKVLIPAACVALILSAGLFLWPKHQEGQEQLALASANVQGRKDGYGIGATGASPVTDGTNAARQTETAYAAVEEPLLDFQEISDLMVLDVAPPYASYQEPLALEDIATIWGSDTLESLEGYELTGIVIYDSKGTPWEVSIYGEGEDSAFHLQLAPDHLPYSCTWIAEGTQQSIDGTDVDAVQCENSWHAAALREGTEPIGIRVMATGDDGAKVVSRLMNLCLKKERTLTLLHLYVPEEEVRVKCQDGMTEAEARSDERFGKYLPTSVPKRYTFENACRESSWDETTFLTVGYQNGLDYLNIAVSELTDAYPILDASNPDSYDLNRYDNISCAPEEYRDTLSNGVFQATDLTLDVIRARTKTVSDAGDTDSPRIWIRVCYPDGTMVSITGRATPEETYAMLAEIPH